MTTRIKRIFVFLLSLAIIVLLPSCNETKSKPADGEKQEQKGPDALPETVWTGSFMSLTWELYFMNDADVQVTWRNKERQSKSARGQYTLDGNTLTFTKPLMIDEVRKSELSQTIIGYELRDATISGNRMSVSMNVVVVSYGSSAVQPGDYQVSFVWQQ